MTAGYAASGTGGYPENYYEWTTTQTTNQTYDIVVSIPVPPDYGSSIGVSVDVNTSSTANGPITAKLYDTTGTVVTNWNSCTLTPSSANTWTNKSCAISSGTYNTTGNNTMTLMLTLQAAASGGTTYVGNITVSYTSAY
jgi:hypothetical protein